MKYLVRVRDNNEIVWEKRYNTLKESIKARKWHENDHNSPVSIEEEI